LTRITHPALNATVGLSLQLQGLLTEAESAQWQRSRVIQGDEDDPGIRSKGSHGDPTFDAVSDPARLALRAAVIQAEDLLTRHHAEAHEAAAGLQKALDRWNGGL
jgi:hypothetical protein